jgi:hypothetical protein
MPRPTLLLLLVALAVFPLYGQKINAPPPLVEKINVSVVSVDVTVTDNHGRPHAGD